MIKSLFETVLIILLPLLIIFAVYRYCMGYGPLNFKAVITIISDQFSSSANYFLEFTRLVSSVMEESYLLAEGPSSVLEVGFAPLDAVTKFLVTVFTNIIATFTHAFDYIRVSTNFLFSLVGDFVGAIVALSEFLVDSSPYLVQPYFPVGS